MTQYETLTLSVAIITVLITLMALLYAGIQLNQAKQQLKFIHQVHLADHDWHRRMSAQNALKEYNQSILLNGLQSKFDYLNRKEPVPLSEVETAFAESSDLQSELHKLLNFYESLARGIFQEIYDEEVIKSARRSSMVEALNAFRSYIDNRRAKLSPNSWIDLEAIVAKWVLEEKGISHRVSTSVKL
jgi:hypothetical protein